ncbi:hypothetical protein LCAZH_0049 [Lacticaseibacillus paracasei]|nr:hypothetical protein LCAZH_0049 [Lacticaseibacillus paracasei]AGP66803.1 Hypothetical protein LOCK919_0047 [Lacticaseibacillus paracasei]EPC28288.1 hypothetical protein Lpp46_0477 [Lacticaseibacillus paracasei subsp. paracasei Lpp46]
MVDLEKVATYTVLGLLTIASTYALVQSGGTATPGITALFSLLSKGLFSTASPE